MRLRRRVYSRFRPAYGKGICLAKSPSPLGEPAPAPLRGSLRCSQDAAAAQLGLRSQTVLAEFPRLAVLLGAFQGGACCMQRCSRKMPLTFLK
ncbi:hypothetical protein SAMN05660284_01380 [Formivibrio citricus]|uniref:Uncharacterized protein n=1 Tax=Formivibrio citricus TaxID=83765 RepID=A0A1I4YNK1_9NEIS|nr:hypothetical protein SAMN05660284_01380 [Formivibrio citricus]